MSVSCFVKVQHVLKDDDFKVQLWVSAYQICVDFLHTELLLKAYVTQDYQKCLYVSEKQKTWLITKMKLILLVFLNKKCAFLFTFTLKRCLGRERTEKGVIWLSNKKHQSGNSSQTCLQKEMQRGIRLQEIRGDKVVVQITWRKEEKGCGKEQADKRNFSLVLVLLLVFATNCETVMWAVLEAWQNARYSKGDLAKLLTGSSTF